jgi:hypothetical protein
MEFVLAPRIFDLFQVETAMLEKTLVFSSDNCLVEAARNLISINVRVREADALSAKEIARAFPEHHRRERRIDPFQNNDLYDRKKKTNESRFPDDGKNLLFA